MPLQAMLLPDVNSLANVICAEINQSGPMPFARFMELALYCPELGFYDRFPHRIGRTGDFITSVSVGPLFGRLLAFRFSRWLDHLQLRSSRAQLVEAGAHDGQLALDILTWLGAHDPKQLSRLQYVIIEPSSNRQAWQRAKLLDFEQNVSWIRAWGDVAPGTFRGILFSNELLDAFPAHRFAWDACDRRWFEYGVTLREERLVWCPLAQSSALKFTPQLPETLGAILPEGFTIDVVPAARRWWWDAAAALAQGYL